VKPALFLTALLAVAFGCANPGSPTDRTSVQVNGTHSRIAVTVVPPWARYGQAVSVLGALCLRPVGLPTQPTASINFEFKPEGTGVAQLLLQQPWRDSEGREKTTVRIGSTNYLLFHREGDLTDCWFVIIPLQAEVIVASLTVAKEFEDYIPQFRSEFQNMLSTLQIQTRTL